MSSSVKVINTITETNSQAIVDAVDALLVSGHQTDSFTLGSGNTQLSTTYNVNDYKGITVAVNTSTDAGVIFQAHYSNDQTTWYYDYTNTVFSTSNTDGTTTLYQGTYTLSQLYGKFVRLEYYNPNASSTDIKSAINFLH